MAFFKKGDYLAIEINGFDNRIIYCILDKVLYVCDKIDKIIGYVYVYDNTLLPIGQDLIKNIEVSHTDKVRQCSFDEFNAVNNILFKNDLMWNPGKNNLISVKENRTPNAYTIKAYMEGSRYISHDRTLLLLKDLKSAFDSEFFVISIIEKGATGIICPKTLLQADLHCTIKFELKGSDLTDVYRVLEELKKHGIKLLCLNIDNVV